MRVAGVVVAVLVVVAGGRSLASAGTPEPARCNPNRLSVYSTGLPPGDTEDVGAVLVITTRSTTACLLTGRPRASAQLSTGRIVGVTAWHVTLPPDTGHVTVTSRDSAFLLFHDATACVAGNRGPPFYVEITVSVAGQKRRITRRGRARLA
jgi:hypothetical protein